MEGNFCAKSVGCWFSSVDQNVLWTPSALIPPNSTRAGRVRTYCGTVLAKQQNWEPTVRTRVIPAFLGFLYLLSFRLVAHHRNHSPTHGALSRFIFRYNGDLTFVYAGSTTPRTAAVWLSILIPLRTLLTGMGLRTSSNRCMPDGRLFFFC